MNYEYFCKEEEKVHGIINADTPSRLQLARKSDWLETEGNFVVLMEAEMGSDLINIDIIKYNAETGLIEVDTDKKSEIEHKAQIQALKATRDEALANNTVAMLGHTFDARPKDLSNIQLGIEKNETLWPDINDYMVDVVNTDLVFLLATGVQQGEIIWDTYKQSVKAIQ
ncbi:MAG: hypothetical protein GY750_20950 [Lentisphaerae bacterium]|nr:hypothetical protein [Lentisphaerota bacterium]